MKGKRTTSRSRQPVLLLSQEEGTTRAAIDYKRLRRINPQAARQAVLEYLASVDGNVAATARAFGITRPVVYDILAKARSGDLGDRPKIPRHQPRKTPAEVAGETGLTPEQVSRVFRDIQVKRKTTLPLHRKPILLDGVPEIEF